MWSSPAQERGQGEPEVKGDENRLGLFDQEESQEEDHHNGQEAAPLFQLWSCEWDCQEMWDAKNCP